MKKTVRRSFFIFLILAFFILAVFLDKDTAFAEDVNVTVYSTPEDPKPGDAVTLSISVTGNDISAYTLNVSYSSGVLQYDHARGASASGGGGTVTVNGQGAGTVSLDFTASQEGASKITVSGVSAENSEGESKSIGSTGMTVRVGSSGQDKERDDEAETPDDGEVTIDLAGKKFALISDDSYTNLPEGFVRTESTYEGQKIQTFTYSEILTIAALKAEDGSSGYYIYYPDTETFAPYTEFITESSRMVITVKPDSVKLPYGFEKYMLSIDQSTVESYIQSGYKDVVLVYAINLKADDIEDGFYYFDTEIRSFVKYFNPEDEAAEEIDASPEDAEKAPQIVSPFEEKSSSEEDLARIEALSNAVRLLVALLVISLIAVIILIILYTRALSSLDRSEYETDEEDIEEEIDEEIEGDAEAAGAEDDGESDSNDSGNDDNSGSESFVDVDAGSNDETDGETADSDRSGDGMETEGDAEDPETPQEEEEKPKVLFEDLNTETGGIIVEEALYDNQKVGVIPKTYEESRSSLEKAMEERPYGIDSAFDVVPEEIVERVLSKKSPAPEPEAAGNEETESADESSYADVAESTDAIKPDEEAGSADDSVSDTAESKDVSAPRTGVRIEVPGDEDED